MIKLSSFLILGIVSLLVLFTNNIIYGQQPQNITSSNEPIKFIALQHAQSGSISKVNATTNSLELHDVSDVILFPDRPDRIVKTESTQQFLDRWYDAGTDTKNSFFSDPPNAALVIDDQEGQNVAILEFFEPAYDYDSNILIYNFSYLNNNITKLPNEFGETTLVIDSSALCAGCGGRQCPPC